MDVLIDRPSELGVFGEVRDSGGVDGAIERL
jgi:hypothetical protein